MNPSSLTARSRGQLIIDSRLRFVVPDVRGVANPGVIGADIYHAIRRVLHALHVHRPPLPELDHVAWLWKKC